MDNEGNKMFDRNEVLQIISDVSKDAYGYRVRYDYNAMSDAELKSTFDLFCKDADRAAQEYAEAQKVALVEWTSHIDRLMRDNGVDRETAIRWDRAAMGVDEDSVGYYCYLWNINRKAVDL